MRNRKLRKIKIFIISFLLMIGPIAPNLYGEIDNKDITYTITEELIENDTISTITLQVIPSTKIKEILKIENPDKSIVEKESKSTYQVTENKEYEFIVYYTILEEEENNEIQEVEKQVAIKYQETSIKIVQQEPKVMEPTELEISKQEDVKQQSKTLEDRPVKLATGDVLINETNFPDAAFREFLKMDTSSVKGYGQDGVFTREEISQIGRITCSGRDITDLTGIEYFSFLGTLECNNNKLTSLDISQNKALITLFCISNQLTSLDVSQNTKLANLICSKNKLPSLDISQNLALTMLNCSSNQLTNLDISKNTALSDLLCAKQKIAIPMSKNRNTWTSDMTYSFMSGITFPSNITYNGSHLETVKLPKSSEISTTIVLGSNKTAIFSGTLTFIADEYYLPVSTITDVPTQVYVGSAIPLQGNILPIEATYKDIVWSIKAAGTTGATITENVLHTKKTGTVELTATIINGTEDGNYQQNFSVEVLDFYLTANDAIIDVPTAKTITDLNNLKSYSQLEVMPPEKEKDVQITCIDFDKLKAGKIGKYTVTYTLESLIRNVTFDVGIGIDSTSFPDSQFRKYLLSTVSGKDKILTINEISEIKEMNCSKQGIKDLTGIEYFTALTTIDCSQNELLYIDTSKNPLLTTITSNNQTRTIELAYQGNQWISKDSYVFNDSLVLGNDISYTNQKVVVANLSYGKTGSFTTSKVSGTLQFSFEYLFAASNALITIEEAKTVYEGNQIKDYQFVETNPIGGKDSVLVTCPKLSEIQAGKVGNYEVTYTLDKVTNTVNLQVVDIGYQVSDDRQIGFYGKNTKITKTEALTISKEILLQRVVPKVITAMGTSYSDINMFDVDVDSVHNSTVGTKEIEITFQKGSIETNRTISLEILEDSPDALVSIPSTINLDKIKGDAMFEAIKEEKVSIVKGTDMTIFNKNFYVKTSPTLSMINTSNQKEKFMVQIYDASHQKYCSKDIPLAILNSSQQSQIFYLKAYKDIARKKGNYIGIMSFTIGYGGTQ